MKTQNMLAMVALGAALISIPVAAQTMPAPPEPTELKTYLNLTDTQVQQIQDLMDQTHESTQTTMEAIRTQEEGLKAALDGGTTDAAAVGKMVLAINTLRTQVKKTMDTARQSAQNLLTADQKTKLQTLDAAAKLHQEIRQAVGLGLLTPPVQAGPGGPGGGPQGGGPGGPGGGPAGFGPPPQI